MKKALIVTPFVLALSLTGTCDLAFAQARYDDHELSDKFKITLGGFQTNNTDSTIRIDSKNLGLGTIIDLEDTLKVEDSASVARMDGYYRFNRAHRIEWTSYSLTRNGTTLVDTDIQIGDVIFPVGFTFDTEWKFNINKVSYAWSFINVENYELYLGGGLNVPDLSLTVLGASILSGEERAFDDSGTLPLPTLIAGLRYNILDKLAVRFRIENFFLQSGDNKGQLQDTYLLLEYDITEHFGIGGGINTYILDLKTDIDDDFFGEIEVSYTGLLLYFSGSF